MLLKSSKFIAQYNRFFIFNYMKISFLTLFFTILLTNLLAQSNIIKVKVVDEKKEGIANASIKIKNKSNGTICNADGFFVLNIDEVSQADSVLISSIGFETYSISVKDLLVFNNKSIQLKILYQNLREVKVISEESIISKIREAILNTKSLMLKTGNFEGYYKELVYGNNSLTKFADGVISGYIDNTNTPSKYQLKIVESRFKEDTDESKSKVLDLVESQLKISLPFEKGFNFTRIVKMLDEKTKYSFYIFSEDANNIIYTIEPKEGIKEPLQTTNISIAKKNNKIESLESSVNAKQAAYFKGMKLLSVESYIKTLNIKLIYQNDDDVSYLKYYKCDVDQFLSTSKEKFDFVYKSEMLLTKVNIVNPIEVPAKEQYKKKNLFRNGNKFIGDFWSKYNTILLNEKELKEINNLK